MYSLNYLIELINSYLKDDKGNLNIYGKMIKIFIIIILVKLTIALVNRIINRTFKKRKHHQGSISDGRATTLRELLKSLVQKFFYFMGAMTILEMFNINTKSILATAGIGGLAIGFGAQSLVKDIITGFFILLEDQYAVGDYVGIGSFEGVVEELGIRVTKLRDFSGELHIIPNGNITIVTNKARGAMRALVEVSISYEEDIDNALTVLKGVCEDIKRSNDSLVEGPDVVGVTDLGESEVKIRIVAKTIAMDQWSIEREIRKKVKEAFDKEKIEIPYPRIVIFGGQKDDIEL